MEERVFDVIASFVPTTEGRKIKSGVMVNFVIEEQYFPCKVVLCDSEYHLRLEVLINNDALEVKESTNFSLRKGPLFDLGNGIVINSSRLSG